MAPKPMQTVVNFSRPLSCSIHCERPPLCLVPAPELIGLLFFFLRLKLFSDIALFERHNYLCSRDPLTTLFAPYPAHASPLFRGMVLREFMGDVPGKSFHGEAIAAADQFAFFLDLIGRQGTGCSFHDEAMLGDCRCRSFERISKITVENLFQLLRVPISYGVNEPIFCLKQLRLHLGIDRRLWRGKRFRRCRCPESSRWVRSGGWFRFFLLLRERNGARQDEGQYRQANRDGAGTTRHA